MRLGFARSVIHHPAILCGLAAIAFGATMGCVAPGSVGLSERAAIERYIRPLLEMDPDANWTHCYNRLLENGPDAVEYLLRRPELNRRAAPDDLRVMLATSLLRLLAQSSQAPRLTATCYETTLELLFFEIKVLGRSLGEIRIPAGYGPISWHDLYPTAFNQLLAQAIDVERDRQVMVLWWRVHRKDASAYRPPKLLRPITDSLWPLLSRRYADVWTYEVKPAVFTCGYPQPTAWLLRESTREYNLVRAACIWLGSSNDPLAHNRLIELVADPSEVISYNAWFALRFNPDSRIRNMLERYNQLEGVPPPELFHTRANSVPDSRIEYPAGLPRPISCREQRSVRDEMDPIRRFLHPDSSCGRVHSGPFRWSGNPPARE